MQLCLTLYLFIGKLLKSWFFIIEIQGSFIEISLRHLIDLMAPAVSHIPHPAPLITSLVIVIVSKTHADKQTVYNEHMSY